MSLRIGCAFALLGATLLSLASPGSSEPLAASVPTAADFGAGPDIEDPLLSPDGRFLAARGGTLRILLTDLSGTNRATRVIALPDGQLLEQLRWAGSGKLLIARSAVEQVAGKKERVTRLATIDVADGRQRLLAPDRKGVTSDNIIHIDPAGQFLLLSAAESEKQAPAVYRVDLATGADQQVVAPQRDVWDWYADSAGVVRAGVATKGDRRWIVYRATERTAFRRSAGDGGDADQLVPIAGSDQGYAIANTRDGRYALYRYDFARDRLGALVYENPRGDVEAFETSAAGELLGVGFTEDRPQNVWFDAGLKAAQAEIDRLRPGAINRIASMSRDRNRLLVWSGADTDPGSLYLFDRIANRFDLIAPTNRHLADKRLSKMQSVRYRARDGLEIQAYLTLPAGREARGLPLIVMPHGGPYVRDNWGYDPWVQYLAAKGYAVLQPNYRGSTGFGREFLAAGDGQWGRGMQDDADDGLKWLVARGTVDAKRVCMMGASYGGYAAMWAAVRNPELYRCTISLAGISDVAAQLDFDRKTFDSAAAFRAWNARIQGKAKSLAELSPLAFVDRMTVPILIAHGTADTTVPYSQSVKLHEALVKLGRDHDFVLFPGAEHNLGDPEYETRFLERIGAFLDKHNPA